MIHDKTFFLVHQTEQMSGKEKFHVERRILAHEDNVTILESTGFEFSQSIMGCAASDVNSTPTPIGGAGTDEQVVEFHVINFMLTLLRLEQQHKSGVLVDVNFLDRIHDDPDFQYRHKSFRMFRTNPGLPRCEPNSRASLSFRGSTESTETPTGREQNQPLRASAKKPGDTSPGFALAPPLEAPKATSRWSFPRCHEKSQNTLLPNLSIPT